MNGNSKAFFLFTAFLLIFSIKKFIVSSSFVCGGYYFDSKKLDSFVNLEEDKVGCVCDSPIALIIN